MQHRLTLRFAALVHRGSLRIGPQRTDVHQALNAGGLHGLCNFAGQLDMNVFKTGFGAIQNGNQIDHGIVPGHQAGQISFAVNRGFENGQARQILNASGMAGAPCGHRDLPAQSGQLLAYLSADKTTAP